MLAAPCPVVVVMNNPSAAARLADTSISAQILKLVPTAPSRMVTIVAGGIPYKLRDRDVQCAYMHGALQLAQRPAAAAVREGILAAAVIHLLGLVVEVWWQDIAAADPQQRPTQRGGTLLMVRMLSAEAEEEEGESEK